MQRRMTMEVARVTGGQADTEGLGGTPAVVDEERP
jgi:hypothetical protein